MHKMLWMHKHGLHDNHCLIYVISHLCACYDNEIIEISIIQSAASAIREGLMLITLAFPVAILGGFLGDFKEIFI